MASTQLDRITGLRGAAAIKAPCIVAVKTTNIALFGLQTLQGVTLVEDDRVLVSAQTDSRANGIYLAKPGFWVRAPDFDGSNDLVAGGMVYVTGGDHDGLWRLVTTGVINVGTDDIEFAGIDYGPDSVRYDSLGDDIRLDSDYLITVGTGGDYPTLNAALAVASHLRMKEYKAGGILVEVRQKAGFILAEQIRVVNDDLSFITLTSEGDEEVTIQRSALTLGALGDSDHKPAFAAYHGALPTIACLYNMDTSGYDSQRDGIFMHTGSVYVADGAGIKNVGGIGAAIYRHSVLIGDGSIWDGAKARYDGGSEHGGTIDGACIYAMNGSYVQANDASLQHGGDNGIYINVNSMADMRSANASYADRRGFYINQGSVMEAREAIANNCGTTNVLGYGGYVNRASRAQFRDAVFNGCQTGIGLSHGATAWAEGMSATNAIYNGIDADRGSIVSAPSSILTGAGHDGVSAQNGSVVTISDAGDVSTAGRYGLFAYSSGRIVADGVTANNCVGGAMLAGYGAHINFRTGITNGKLSVAQGGEIMAHAVTGTPTYSQPLNFDGPSGRILGNNDFTLLDDTATSIFVGGKSAVLLICGETSATTSPRGSVWVAPIAVPLCQVIAMASPNANISYSTGALAGTTGTDGNFTISAHTDGRVYFENRSGNTRHFTVAVLAWTQ
jgi:hypothetical protein